MLFEGLSLCCICVKGRRRKMGCAGLFTSTGALPDLKPLSRLLYVCLCVNAWLYLCFPIKGSFGIDLFRVGLALISVKKKWEGSTISSFCVCGTWMEKERISWSCWCMDSLFLSASSGSIPIHLWSSCMREHDRVRGRGWIQIVRAVIVLLDLYWVDFAYKVKPNSQEWQRREERRCSKRRRQSKRQQANRISDHLLLDLEVLDWSPVLAEPRPHPLSAGTGSSLRNLSQTSSTDKGWRHTKV